MRGPVAIVLAALLLVGCAAERPDVRSHRQPTRSAPTLTQETGAQGNQAKKAEKQARKHKTIGHGPLVGADVSWPQCPKGMGIPQRRSEGQPMPSPHVAFVVIGLTNGPGFTPNPCLAGQVAWARAHKVPASAYAVVSWPAADRPGGLVHPGPFDSSTRAGALRNAGWAQARFNLDQLHRAGLRTPAIWVDVEPYPTFPWSSDVGANAEVVRGAVRGYQDAGLRVGLYSVPSLWTAVVGDLRLGLPEWRAAGFRGRDEAARRCAQTWSFQGGSALMGQWTTGARDFNITCNGLDRELDSWFGRP